MKIEITGRIESIGEVETRGNFSYRTMVVVQGEDDKYPNYYPVQFTKDSMSELDRYSPGDVVRILAYLNGRKYEKDGDTRYFVTVSANSVQVVGGRSEERPSGKSGQWPQNTKDSKQPTLGESNGGDFDDVPF